jgi:hypothetical protein
MSGRGLDRAIARVQVWISRLLCPNVSQTDLALAFLFPHFIRGSPLLTESLLFTLKQRGSSLQVVVLRIA